MFKNRFKKAHSYTHYIELIVLLFIIIIDFNIRYSHFKYISKIHFLNHPPSLPYNETACPTGEKISWPQELKNFMIPITDKYVQHPLAMILYRVVLADLHEFLHITRKTLADLLTLSYILFSIPTVWLLANIDSKKLVYRQIACGLFQLKNIIDSVDGQVARGGEKIVYEKNKFKIDGGFIFDAAANGISAICFFIGSFIYIWRRYSSSSVDKCDYEKLELAMDKSCEKSNSINNKKYTKKQIGFYIIAFIIYFIISSAGWDLVWSVYSKEVIHNQVSLF